MSCISATAVIVFDTDASMKTVSVVTGLFWAMSARP